MHTILIPSERSESRDNAFAVQNFATAALQISNPARLTSN
jgi:hypothetical protein